MSSTPLPTPAPAAAKPAEDSVAAAAASFAAAQSQLQRMSTDDAAVAPSTAAAPTSTTTTTATTTTTTTEATVRTIRVLVAGTGATYKLSLHPSELTVANIRSHLAAAVPLEDQILLLGPPYKVPKDATLQQEEVLNALRLGDMEDDPIYEENPPQQESATAEATPPPTTDTLTPTFLQQQQQQQEVDEKPPRKLLSTTTKERSGARRLFLFSKQSLLSDHAPDPPPCHLEPMDVTLPTEADGPSPLQLTTGSSAATDPLQGALVAYERQFMLCLNQGRVLADAADLRLAACRSCVKEQAVMARALRAAVSNLSEHQNNAVRTRAAFSATFLETTGNHAQLLQGLEGQLGSLAAVPLDPSLSSIARASGHTMATLLDTVPVDRERVWAQTCQHSHQRLLTLYNDLETAFGDIGSRQTRTEESQEDAAAEEEIEAHWRRVVTTCARIRDRQAERAQQLTVDHGKVVALILAATASQNDDDVQAAFGPLRQRSNASLDTIPLMCREDAALKEHMVILASAKTAAMKRICKRLRDISVAQSSIVRANSMVGVVRDALGQQTKDMEHLEHVAELPQSYRDFLAEIRRRRAYIGAVTSYSTAMMERLATLREEETRSRERFLRGSARHLMPAFVEIFCPTLQTPPPLFTPQLPFMAEVDTLPDVAPETTAASGTATTGTNTGPMEGDSSADAGMAGGGGGGTSSASSLTAESPMPAQEMLTTSVGTQPQEQQSEQGQPQGHQQQLIVSADESNRDNMILDQGEAAVATDAQIKTLAYENAVLRQAVERMGGHPPRVYLEEASATANENSSAPAADSNLVSTTTATAATTPDASALEEQASVITSLRKELAEAKSASARAEKALKKQKEILSREKRRSDKISHSSFAVGEVGLFMPTGRGSGGRRTYLAFHTNCPHRYLNTDNIRGSPDFVLGRIVYQEELVAGPAGTDANPYGLHVGTPFWVLTVEVLT